MALTTPAPNRTKYASGTSTTPSVVMPAQVEVGQLLVCCVAYQGAATITITAAAGWTQVGATQTGQSMCSAVFWKVAVSGDTGGSSTGNFTLSASKDWTISWQSYDWVNTTTPVNVSNSQSNAASTTVTAPAVTPTSGQTTVITFHAQSANTASMGVPSGVTRTSYGTNASNLTSAIYINPKPAVSGSSTGTVASTSSLSAASHGWTIALNAATAPTTGVYKVDHGYATTGTPATSLATQVPSTVAVGDVVLLSVNMANATDVLTTPSGWTVLQSANPTGWVNKVLYRVWQSGDSAPVLSLTSSIYCFASTVIMRGGSAPSASSTSQSNSIATISTTATTAATASSALVNIYSAPVGEFSGSAWATLSTEQVLVQASSGSGMSNVMSFETVAAGAVATKSATLPNSATAAATAIAVVIPPAGGGGGGGGGTFALVQASAEARAGNALTVTANYGATPTAGNLLIAFHRCDETVAANVNKPTAQWTKGPQVIAGFATTLFYKIAGAGEPTAITVQNTTSTGPCSLMVFEYSGNSTDIATVLDTSLTTQVASGLTHTTDPLTIANASDLLFCGIALASAGTTTGWNNAWNSSFTRVGTPISGNNSNIECAHRIPAATGAFSTTETWTTNARTSRSVLAAFLAAPAGGGATTKTVTHSVDAQIGSVNYVQAAGEFRANAATTITGSFAQIPQQGNLILIVHRCPDSSFSGQLAPPSGWSVAARITGGPSVNIWYKVAGVSEPTSITVTNGTSGVVGMYLFEYTNTVAANVFDQKATGATTGGGVTTATSPNLTTLNANDLIIAAFAHSSQTTWNNAWTNGFGRIGVPATGGTSTLEVSSKLVSTTGTYNTTETWADAGQGTMAMASFKALGRVTNTLTNDNDALILRYTPVSQAVDAVILGHLPKAHSADADLLKQGVTRAHGVDVDLRKTLIRTHTVEVIALKTKTVTSQVESVLAKTRATTSLVESILQKTTLRTSLVDSDLRKTSTVTHSVDAKTIPRTFTASQLVDAVLGKTRTATHSVDANVNAQQSAFPQHNVDYILIRTVALSSSVNAILLAHTSRAYSTDSVALKHLTKIHSADALIKKVTLHTAAVDTVLLGRLAKSAAVDVLTLRGNQRVYAADAKIDAGQSTVMYGAVPYGMPFWAQTNTMQRLHFVDAALFIPTKRITVSVDGRFVQAVGTQHITYSSDADIKFTQTKSYSTDTRFSLSSPKVYFVDADVKGSLTKPHTVSVVLLGSLKKSYTTDALALQRKTVAYSVDTLKKKTLLRAYGVDALGRKTRTVTHGVNAGFKKSINVANFTDALFSKAALRRSYVVDASLVSLTRRVSHYVDASYRHVLKRTHKVNAVISFQKNPHGTWLDTVLPYRRALQIVAPLGGLPVNHPVTATVALDKTVVRGKMRADLSDVVIAYGTNDTPREWIVLPAQVTSDGTNVVVNFPLAADLPDGVTTSSNYYIYYGNRTDLIFAATPSSYVPIDWPILVAYGDPGVSYTRPGEHWRTGISNVKHAKATLRFDGIKIRIIANTGPANGIAQVQIDDGPWVDVDQYSVSDQQAVEVFSQDLEVGRHVIRVQVSGRKNPSSTGTTVNIVRFEHKKAGIAIDVHEEIIDLMWTSTVGST